MEERSTRENLGKMQREDVYSPIEDNDIKEHLEDSIIWKSAFKKEEITDLMLHSANWWIYSIKFDGLKPVQLLNIRKI